MARSSEADDTAAAVDLARQQRPDIAIIDMRLPDMPGHDLCRALRRLLPEINVIALSSYLTEDAVRKALNAGASAYVTKAAGLAELRGALDEAFARVRGRWDQDLNATQIVR